jgi:hypothetical protein
MDVHIVGRQDQPPQQPDGNPPLTHDATVLIIICWVFTPLSAIFVVLRFWCRRIKRQHLVFNDWAIVVALVFNFAQSALLTYASVAGGIGHHMADLLASYPDAVTRLLQCFVAAEPLWIATNSMVKLSILDLYVRIFPSRTFRYICYTLMSIVSLYWLSTFVRMFLMCRPFAALWDLTLAAEAECIDLPAAYLSVSIINLVLDFALVLLPMPILWHLQLETRKKIMLIGIFGLGIGICVITGLRIRAVLELDLVDTSYTVVDMGIWSTLEPCLAIISACLPLLQPLVQRVPGLRDLSSRIHSGTGGSSKKTGHLRGVSSSAASEARNVDPGRRHEEQHRQFVPLRDLGTKDNRATTPGSSASTPQPSPHRNFSRHPIAQSANGMSGSIMVTVSFGVDDEPTGSHDERPVFPSP